MTLALVALGALLMIGPALIASFVHINAPRARVPAWFTLVCTVLTMGSFAVGGITARAFHDNPPTFTPVMAHGITVATRSTTFAQDTP